MNDRSTVLTIAPQSVDTLAKARTGKVASPRTAQGNGTQPRAGSRQVRETGEGLDDQKADVGDDVTLQRDRLVDLLIEAGHVRSERVGVAFRPVLRHPFLPTRRS